MLRILIPIVVTAGVVWASYSETVAALPRLPDKIATHFNGAGVADGWGSKDQLFKAWALAMAGLGGLFAFVVVFIRIAPASSINLPRRDYWLAPERVGIARRMMIERMLWFTAGTMAFIGWLFHMIIEFNLRGGGRLEIVGPLALFLTFTAGWTGEMIWAFSRGGKEPSSTAPPLQGGRLFRADEG